MEFMVHTPEQLAKVLRGRRKQLRLTQQTAGTKVGLLPKTISALENFPNRTTVQSMFELLSALDLELVLRPKQSENSYPARSEW